MSSDVTPAAAPPPPDETDQTRVLNRPVHPPGATDDVDPRGETRTQEAVRPPKKLPGFDGPRPGTKLGPYRIGAPLGAGAMGSVHRAVHEDLGREVAVKVLRAEIAQHGGALERFRREAQAAARLAEHPGIVGVHDIGTSGDDAWFAMELIEGDTLADLIKQGELSDERAAELLEQTARAIAHAHREGVLHRDLKPTNLIVAHDGTVRVTDFGLAGLVDTNTAADGEQLTLPGSIVGTPAYMAPEQAAGEAVDRRTDIYGLGATLYEALCGKPPYTSRSLAQLLVQVTAGVMTPAREHRPDLPRDLDAILHRSLALDAADRYPTADAFADDLARWRKREPITARGGMGSGAAGRALRRNPGTVATVALGLVAAIAGGILITQGLSAKEQVAGDTDDAMAAASAADRAAALARTYRWVGAASQAPMALLARRFHGAELKPAEVDAALAEVKRIVESSPDERADAKSPGAWLALAHLYAGRDAHAATLLQDLGDDPLAALLAARVELARYGAEVQFPPVEFGEKVRIGRRPESEAMKAARAAAHERLAAAARMPAWALLPADGAMRVLADGYAAVADDRPANAIAQLTKILDEPLLGAEARFVVAYAHYLSGQFETAAGHWEACGALGWPDAWSRSGTAWLSEAVTRLGSEGDPTPACTRAIDALTKALELRPGDLGYRQRRAQAWSTLARHRTREGIDPTDAAEASIADYTAVLDEAPEALSSLNGRANALRHFAGWVGDHGRDPRPILRRALSDLDGLTERHPRYLSGWITRGLALQTLATVTGAYGGDPTDWFAESQASLDTALGLSPNNYAVLTARGQGWQALAMYQQKRGMDPARSIDRALDEFDSAIAGSTSSLAARAGRATVLLGRAEHAYQRGRSGSADLEEALAELTRGLADAPTSERLLSKRAYAYLTKARVAPLSLAARTPALDAAVADADAALSANPLHATARVYRAMCGIERGQLHDLPLAQRRAALDAAVADLRAALSRESTNPTWRDHLGSALQWRGRVEALSGRSPIESYRASVAEFDAVLERMPGYNRARNNRGSVLLGLAGALRDAGRPCRAELDRAEADFSQTLKQSPRYAFGWSNRGQAREGLAREHGYRGQKALDLLEGALSDYRHAQSLNARLWQAFAAEGLLLVRMRRFADAISPLEKAAALNPQLLPALADARRQAGR